MVSIFDQLFDRSWLSENILKLYHIERKQTFPAWQQATEFTRDLLAEEGFEPEFISFPADGKTAYQDKVIPIGWNVNHMKLTVLTPVPGLKDPVIADFEREPLGVVKHSVATPEDGIVARLVTQSQMKAGADVRNAFVLLDPSARPHKEDLQMLLDLGAYGWVSDYVENPLVDPNGVAWLNAGTEHNSWHVPADERDFIGYQISPMNGFRLRAACEAGEVLVHAQSDAYRYETTLPAVTAVLKGEREEEVWLLAHLHEPLIDDNSSGVMGCIDILRAMRRLAAEGKIRLKYSVRVLFSSEMYGVAAYIEHIGDARRKVLGAINMDGLVASTDKCSTALRAIEGPDYTGTSRTGGFAGNLFIYETIAASSKVYPEIRFLPQTHRLSDDCCIGDSTVGIPTIWFYHTPDGFHHNSVQDESAMDVDNLVRNLAICADWIRRMACTDADDVRAMLPAAVERAKAVIKNAAQRPIRKGQNTEDYMRFICDREAGRIRALARYCDIPEIEAAAAELEPCAWMGEAVETDARQDGCSWYDFCAKFRFTRLTRGFPHDLAVLPPEDRFRMPGDILEDDLASVISRCTDTATMQDAIRETEWDKGMIFSESRIRDGLLTFIRLHRAGYLGLATEDTETAQSLKAALRALGICEGDTLLVTACPEEIGYVEGGADALVKAICEVLGDQGTLLVPGFASSVVMDSRGVNRSAGYRPYDTRPDGELRDQTLRKNAFVRAILNCPQLKRSGHPTHEWLAIGKNAGELVSGHGFCDGAYSGASPVKKAVAGGARILCIGGKMENHPAFIALGDAAQADNCVFRYLDEAGKLCIGMVECSPADDDSAQKLLEDAVNRGFSFRTASFGMGTICLADPALLPKMKD